MLHQFVKNLLYNDLVTKSLRILCWLHREETKEHANIGSLALVRGLQDLTEREGCEYYLLEEGVVLDLRDGCSPLPHLLKQQVTVGFCSVGWYMVGLWTCCPTKIVLNEAVAVQLVFGSVWIWFWLSKGCVCDFRQTSKFREFCSPSLYLKS